MHNLSLQSFWHPDSLGLLGWSEGAEEWWSPSGNIALGLTISGGLTHFLGNPAIDKKNDEKNFSLV